MKDCKKITDKIKKYVMKSVSKSRYEHSVRTAKTAKKMCSIYGEDPKKGYLMGIAHDMCKNFDEDNLILLAMKDGNGLSDIEKNKPSLLHGRAAAVMLQEEFGIEDKEIIQAVANHTFGCRGMCNLAKILFTADKIEPGRDYITNSYIKKLLKQDLDDVIKTVLSDNISFLKKKGKKVALETELLYASLQ
ncbi:MAG: bis(5'-nucleosyl)-tetraphosphatase (symmetrical) YqeK [Treponema sp.]|jgi:nicotinate-nucleotide adenylyltransferase|nr:bis(5'-nucleosyl)-tetraphosphatase (symmetrical) YqeK [Treponema sp.]